MVRQIDRDEAPRHRTDERCIARLAFDQIRTGRGLIGTRALKAGFGLGHIGARLLANFLSLARRGQLGGEEAHIRALQRDHPSSAQDVRIGLGDIGEQCLLGGGQAVVAGGGAGIGLLPSR